MKIEKLDLTESCNFRLSEEMCVATRGSNSGEVTIRLASGSNLVLSDLLDVSGREDVPTVWLLRGDDSSTAILCGGWTFYKINASGHVLWRREISRPCGDDFLVSESSCFSAGERGVFIHDYGVVIFDNQPEVVHVAKKCADELLKTFDSTKLVFERRHDESFWTLNLQT